MRQTDPPHPQIKKPTSNIRGLYLYLVYAIGIAVLLSLYYVIKHRAFAFVDIGIDLYNFYYPIQVAQARQLHRLHDLTWSFQLGLGAYLGLPVNPIRLLGAILPESWQLGARLPIYFLRLILSGAFFFGYLRKIRFESVLSVIGALAFTYSSYAVINGQWDSEGLVILQFTAYLFFFEGYLQSRKFWLAVGAGLVVGAGSIFYTYTFALLTIMYLIARPFFIVRHDNSGYLPTLIKYGCWAALGFLLTAFIQLPNLHYFLNSPRVMGDHSVFSTMLSKAWTLNSGNTINAEIAGIFGKDLLGVGSAYRGYSNYFEAPGFYIGMLLLLCTTQLLGPSAKPREKLLGISSIVLFAAYILWPAMRNAVYGFGHAGFRLSTLWVSAGLLVVGLAGLRRALQSGTWRTGLVFAAGGIIIAVLAVAYNVPSHIRIQRVVMVIAFTSVYCVALWPRANGLLRISPRILISISACELLLFAMPAFMDRNAVKTDGSSSVGSYHDGTEKALVLVRKEDGSSDFYRIEKTYQSIYLNDALVQDYSGTKSDYFHGKSITRFVDEMKLPRPHPRIAYIGSMVGRAKILDLLGVRYILSRNRKLDEKKHITYVGSAGKINVYKNTDAHTIGYLYQKVSSEDAAKKLSVPARDARVLTDVLVQDPAAIHAQLTQLNKDRPPSATASHGYVSLRKVSDIHLEANLYAPRASVFLISMPFDGGWNAWVDDKPTTLFRADYGLTALVLAPGKHEVGLHYSVDGRTLGKWLSLAALLILSACAAFQVISARRDGGKRTRRTASG